MNGTIGFVGLGIMGMPMATRLAEAGHRLIVCDRDPARAQALLPLGVTSRATPAEVACEAATVFICLPDPAAVRDVALGADGLIAGDAVRIVVDLSTTGPRVSAAVARALSAHDIALVDAPVSGGRRGAADGTLTVMAAGADAPYREVEPLLAHLGVPVRCGDAPGLGQLLKVVNNLMSVCSLAVTAEAFALGRKAGLDPRLMLDVINRSSGRNSATEDKYPRAVLTRTFDFGFPVGQSLKDVDLCLAEADALAVPMPIGQLVKQMLTMTGATFGFAADFTHLARLTERWAHIDDAE
ncbi:MULTISPECIES: NAD(P)-dependent oxidoreductase [Burkholderia]|uniref:NAD(P)-dependent oxidoreductase n=1 Tax=Burkholderia TaxID=32008 RepID=UPI00080B9EA8|nr:MULTISPECIES: NAD(P)-dependent oxidoreductase [Burkholderia]MBU9301027.1 NAD(P)-dependent oxidoreductase [Burkholderia multivorans]MCA8479935.1 NAD(P)-dependent oxidoreductase [Burkholderia multivorans]MDR9054739.1 2-(hydroxymethyl)glutarate dehydrogenase [Burkholderia multivorans]MDR9060426.1 2-(hydroxymethyl)glutarate dehydrogenase [Burkholderia multivorans]MDR9066227.1 2-(hydroxymethyl)glutarate dehydrogenase [Burkholderia multivorans]